MEHLNKNSYQVYIIHIIVLGILALSLVNIQIPVYVKYLILTILTFIVSNIIVYAYKSIFQKTISMKLASTVFVLATILSIVVFAKQADYRQGGQSAGWQSTQYNINIDLHQAALQGNIEVVRQNILAGSDLNKKEPDGGGSPLSTAATFGKTEVARALIEAGAEINFVKNDGATPLHVAAFFCHTEMVKLLLEKGADKSILDNNGSTALESLLIPFEDVKGIYEYFAGILDPLGLDLDLEKIKTKRPIIAEMLRNSTSE